MKKIVALLLVVVMMISMTACDFEFNVVENLIEQPDESPIVLDDATTVTSNANNETESSAANSRADISIQKGDEDREWIVGGSNVFMHDNANLLTNDEEQALIDLVSTYAAEMYFNVLFLTCDEAQGLSTREFSDNYMDNLFPHGVEDNIAFVIDMDNMEVYINTMGKAILWLDNADIEAALDSGWGYVEEANWGKALCEIADYALNIIANGGRS